MMLCACVRLGGCPWWREREALSSISRAYGTHPASGQGNIEIAPFLQKLCPSFACARLQLAGRRCGRGVRSLGPCTAMRRLSC